MRPALPPQRPDMPTQHLRTSSAHAAPAQLENFGQQAPLDTNRFETAPVAEAASAAVATAAGRVQASLDPSGSASGSSLCVSSVGTSERRPFGIDANASFASITGTEPSHSSAVPPGMPKLSRIASSILAAVPPRKKPRLAAGEVEQWEAEYAKLVSWITEHVPKARVNYALPTNLRYSDEQLEILERYLRDISSIFAV